MIAASCYTAAERVAKALSSYFTERGPTVADYIKITGQRSVKVALRALARHYEGSEELPLLADAVEALGTNTFFQYLKERLGWELTVLEGEDYIVVPSDRYGEYVGKPYEFFKNILIEYCSSLLKT